MFSLYVHIPYCAVICPYCDFNVHATSPRPETAYVDAVLSEMRHAAISPPWRGDALQSLYLGGGTPSLFEPSSIRRLVDGAREMWDWDIAAEVTLEATPESVSAARLAQYRAAGVNRLSLGLQSMHRHHLARLGRLHGPEDNRAAVEAARAAGFDNLSVDFIFGVPGQTVEEWESDLLDAVALSPEHISAYGLTYEERTPFFTWRARGQLTPVAEEVEEAMFVRTREVLVAAAYDPYEVSSFARPGRRSRHNRSYWSGTSYLGLGAGAHSYVAGRWGRRSANERNPRRYMEAARERGEARAAVEELTRQQAMGEFVFLALRQAEGIDGARFARRFDEEIEVAFPAMASLCGDGLLEKSPEGYRLTPAGLLMADSVFQAFL
jgi:oxygen-independent coproporphyrinogen-3 oxidase